MSAFNNMYIIVQTTGGDNIHSIGKSDIPNKTLDDINISFYWTKVTRSNFCAYPISMSSGSPVELIICYVMVILTSYDTDQYHNTNT